MAEGAPSVGSSASKAVLGRGLLYTFGTAAPVLSNAVVTPVVTRLLDPRDYGVVATALVVITVGMIVGGLGLAAAITRHGILERSGVSGARSLVIRGAAGSAALCALGAATSPWTSGWLGMGDAVPMALGLAAAAGFAVVVNVQSYLRVLDKPAPFVGLSVTSALGGPVAGLALAWLWSPTATGYLSGLVVGYVGSALTGLWLVVRGGRVQHHSGDTRRALRIGLPTIPHQVALYLASGILVLVAGWVFDTTQAGRLQLAVLIGSAPGVLTSSLNNAWAPVVYRTPENHRGEVLEHTARDIGFLTALAAGWVSVAAPLLLRVVAGPEYDPRAMTPAVGLVAAGTVLSVFYLSNVHLVFVSGRSEGLAVVTPASLVVGTGAALLASTLLGLPATGLGMTVTYAALAAGTSLLARRVSATRWRSRVLTWPIGLGLALCLLGGALPWTGAAVGVRVVLAVVIGAASIMVLRHVWAR